jgi:hypothetical protein
MLKASGRPFDWKANEKRNNLIVPALFFFARAGFSP